jgi:[glutamine synthetase] adenylyltransferase / [glutamine synthetase]-adenylyl-L-tyrosine phosphorylase
MDMTTEPVKELILSDVLAEEEIRSRLEPAGFRDWQAAYRCLQRMARIHGSHRLEETRLALAGCLPHLVAKLNGAAGPDSVLVNLERLANKVPDAAALFRYLSDNPRTIDILVTLFSSSQFLSEILLRSPEYFELLTTQAWLAQLKTSDQYYEEAMDAVSQAAPLLEQQDMLRRYQRWELLRIGLWDLLGQYDLMATTGQLSSLADGMVRACLNLVTRQLFTDSPIQALPSGPVGFSVIAMGKLGGRELNYSSDIDLLFITGADEPFYRKVGEKLIEILSSVTGEGFLYRVDMRLRPWGTAGALVTTVDGFVTYLRKYARLWEKQALLKARWIAGDRTTGNDFLTRATDCLFEINPETIRAEVFAMKQRTESFLRQKGRNWGEVKLGEGSIRDIEFCVQYLQLAYGGKQPEVRNRNTLEAIRRLTRYQLLSVEESRALSEGYVFLRTIEHHLQMLHYRQTQTLPNDPESLAHLSRRLGYQGVNAGDEFILRYQQHSATIRSIYLKYIGDPPMQEPNVPAASQPDVRRHIERMDPSYEATFSRQDIARHAQLAGRLDRDHLVQVDAAALEDGRWRVSIVAYDYPGELSLICGLMFVFGLDIHDGNVFTYEPETAPGSDGRSTPRKIVDVFTVRPAAEDISEDLWERYTTSLEELLRLMKAGQRQDARVQLAKRAAEALRGRKTPATPLYPIEIEIDNDSSDEYTVLRISATDTTGFLYELTNALAFHRVYIARMEIETIGSHVRDTLFVTDNNALKITTPQKQREMRAATVLIKHFTHLLPLSTDPESALLHFHEFIGELFRREDWPDEFVSLERPEVLGALAQLLGVSDFLWDDFLRMQYANLFPVVRDVDTLEAVKSRTELQAELEAELFPVHSGPQVPEKMETVNTLDANEVPWRRVLNAFKDREMFRIDMRHILGQTKEFWEFSEELTDLAEVVVNSAYHLTSEDLRAQYGTPRLEDGSIAQMSVLSLGKCGGRELGFASDIELMFVYSGNGLTDGPNPITTSEFFEKVVENFVRSIRARREGIFEIDLQLRPYGKAGSLAVSLEAFRRYFSPDGPAWAYERQALVRLRPIAGDPSLGAQVAALRDAYVYGRGTFDVTAMRAMRERQVRHLVKAGTFNPKYSPGGLVDVEYLVQGLQIRHGVHNDDLHTTNTRTAMAALAAAGILPPEDYTRLHKAHTFLRWLIDSLRMVAGNAKDLVVPPTNTEAFAYLARRLRYGNDRVRLHEDLIGYTAYVQEVNRRLLGV